MRRIVRAALIVALALAGGMSVVATPAPASALPYVGLSEMFAVNVADNGFVAVHALNPRGGYQQFLLHTLTSVPTPAETANVVYEFADFNGDRVTDLYAIDRDDNGYTSVHVLDGADDFQSDLLVGPTLLTSTVDAAKWNFDVADYDADGRADLYVIDRTDNGHTAVHVLDAASGFQTFTFHGYTPLGSAEDPLWQFDVADFNDDHRGDLYAILKDDNGHTAVHVMNAASAFQAFSIHTLTPLGAVHDPNWQLDIGDYDGDGRGDLYALYRNDAGMTAAHVLSASSNFQTWTLHTRTGMGRTDSWNWDLEVGTPGIAATGSETFPEGARIKPPTDMGGGNGGTPVTDSSDCHGTTFAQKRSNGKVHVEWQIYCTDSYYFGIELVPGLQVSGHHELDIDHVQKTCGGIAGEPAYYCRYKADVANPAGKQTWWLLWAQGSGVFYPDDDVSGGGGVGGHEPGADGSACGEAFDCARTTAKL